jgi:hypothetical protein
LVLKSHYQQIKYLAREWIIVSGQTPDLSYSYVYSPKLSRKSFESLLTIVCLIATVDGDINRVIPPKYTMSAEFNTKYELAQVLGTYVAINKGVPSLRCGLQLIK